MSDDLDTETTWLSPEELELARSRLPTVYVDAIPVRVDAHGLVTHVGLLLRAKREGVIPRLAGPLSRMLAAGYYIHEGIVTEALRRAGEEDSPLTPRP